MKTLYLGDIMGDPGIQLIEKLLPQLRKDYGAELVIAQAENLSDGKGIRQSDFVRLRKAGVDFCTGGNHTNFRDEINAALNDPNQAIIRPANYPEGTPGKGHKYVQTTHGPVLVISLLGKIVGKDAELPLENPLQVIDKILEKEKHTKRVATFVNFHGDYSSEKKIIGYYLDGRVTAVIGDHWHVQTADADILPEGTAHITDVGMCGSLDSSLGISYKTLIPRWRDGYQTKNVLEFEGRMQCNALFVESNDVTGLAAAVTPIRMVV